MNEIDFEGNQSADISDINEVDVNVDLNPANQEDATHLNGGGVPDITGANNQPPVEGIDSKTQSNHNLSEGTEVEYDNVVYRVDRNGNLVDDDGKVFKQSKDLQKWLDDNNFSDEQNSTDFTIDSIRNTFGLDFYDDNGNIVEFSNDAKGVESYVNAVLNSKAMELQQGAINKLYSDNPILKQFIDYVQLTGSPRGFGEIPDRSRIVLDQNNENQLIAVIRMAASEFGNKSLNENYIKYLKTTGGLYDEAKNQLEALVYKDKQVQQQIQQRAQQERELEAQRNRIYWEEVSNAIYNRRIGGYLLPEVITKEVNGQKITYNLGDFTEYVSRPIGTDENGNSMTGYVRDLNKLSDKELLDRELLDAWLMWTGGSYKDLINMAIREDNVKRLVAKSKETRTQKHIKINKPKKSGGGSSIVYE